jgi:hypothetical protein
MKVRILIPGRKVDDVSYRCEKCGGEVIRSRATRVVSLTLMLSTPPRTLMNSRLSFDHLAGTGEDRRRHFQAKSLGGLA